MSTLTVTNIKKTGETASRDVSGVASVWVNFDGTGTIAARDSINVASLTDNGTGRQTINLTNAMSDGNYAGVMGGSRYATGSSNNAQHIFINTFTTTSLATQTNSSQGGGIDWELINASICGDLA